MLPCLNNRLISYISTLLVVISVLFLGTFFIKYQDIMSYSNTDVKDLCKDDLYCSYFKSWKKLSKLSCQSVFLEKCISESKIPKGIYDQSRFTLSYDDTDLHKKVQHLFNFAASRTLDLILSSVKSRIRKLHKSLAFLKESLSIVKDNSHLVAAIQTFKHAINKFTTSQKEKHDTKLSQLIPNSYVPNIDVNIAKVKTDKKSKVKRKRKKRKPKSKLHRVKPSKRKKNVVKGISPRLVNESMILNLSSFQLDNNQKELLTLGDSFVPTPIDVNMSEFHDDIDKFINNLRWTHYFHVHPQTTANKHLELERKILSNPKSKTAPKSTSPCLELFIKLVTFDLRDPSNFRKTFDNLKREHRLALNMLKYNQDIVIRKFDKSSGWVIDNKDSYVNKMNKELFDHTTFLDITEEPNIISNVNDKIIDWINENGEHLSNKIATAVVQENSRPGYNYGNYKAHKPDKQYPLRLITSGCGSPVQLLSGYVEYHLKPLVSGLPNVVVDTGDFLRRIDSFNSSFTGNLDSVLLVTWDIIKMYPSIDNSMGISACRDALNGRDIRDPPTDTIIEALKLVLENNVSFFNNRVYKQISGTAMGPSHACSYADLAMSVFDNMVTENMDYESVLLLWSRFRDDIFSLWAGTEEQLHDFTQWLNSINPKIQFTLEASSFTMVNYLDCTIFKQEGVLCTKLYHKPCETFAYMNPSSCHPLHIARNIPYGVAIRNRRICTNLSDFDASADLLIIKFVERGYDSNFVGSQFDRARNLDRESLLCRTLPEENSDNLPTVDNRCFPLVTTYNPRLPNINYILNKHIPILYLDPDIIKFINPKNMFASFRRGKTLNDILVHSRYPTKHLTVDNMGGCRKCTSGCSLCKDYLVESESFTSPHTDKTFYSKLSLKCTDNYVIYLIIDTVCMKAYVGRTENSLRTRWAGHKSHIKCKYNLCNVAAHFSDTSIDHKLDRGDDFNVTLPNSISIQIIDKVIPEIWDTPDSLFHKLCNKESYWQNQLYTFKDNGGLNDRDERRVAQKRHSKK